MGLKRGRPTAIHALSCLVWAASAAAFTEPQRLAVVVPAHAGDLPRTVSALDRWPKTCSPITQESVDLVLYYAEGEDDTEPLDALDTITSTAGNCFADTKLIYANLSLEVRQTDRRRKTNINIMRVESGSKWRYEVDSLVILQKCWLAPWPSPGLPLPSISLREGGACAW